MYKTTIEYLGEDFEVEIKVPYWAMHKHTGGEPSAAYEDEGGDSMWELYVQDMGEKAAKKTFQSRAAKQAAEDKAKNDTRIAKLKAAFDVFDKDGSGCLDTDEVIEILTRMSGGTPLSEADAKEFIHQFDRDGDGSIDVNEFIIAMGVVSDAHDADGDGEADMKDGTGAYDGKEDEFATKLAAGEDLKVAGMEGGNVSTAIDEARRLQS